MVRLRNGESFPKKEEEEPTPLPRKKASKRASNTVVHEDVKPAKQPPLPAAAVGKRKRASKPATSTSVEDDAVKPETKQPTPPPPAAGKGKRASKRASTSVHPNKHAAAAKSNVTVEDTDALNCGMCFLPLKPPIFQCEVGHVVCSSCRNKLKKPAKCHVCGVATDSFRRFYAMERLVESIHVPCTNSAHGCNAKPSYYDQQGHQTTCVMLSQFHCPGGSCGFAGSMDALLVHLAGVHRWPCTTKVREASYQDCEFVVRNGFNFLRTNLPSTTSNTQFLFLLNLACQPDGTAISVFCIQSHAAVTQSPSLKGLKCELWYSRYSCQKGDVIDYYQSSKFKVACTDFSQGLPNLTDRYQFLIPKFALGDSYMDTLKIRFNFKLE
ncbi:hypothetical protein QOZ80_5AG0404500 [Eleusine coracana subsp. coracana]|nr:hypothetical protein QOZ80_5AG0404500 [Eleusine coracana subsp. coracana]